MLDAFTCSIHIQKCQSSTSCYDVLNKINGIWEVNLLQIIFFFHSSPLSHLPPQFGHIHTLQQKWLHFPNKDRCQLAIFLPIHKKRLHYPPKKIIKSLMNGLFLLVMHPKENEGEKNTRGHLFPVNSDIAATALAWSPYVWLRCCAT